MDPESEFELVRRLRDGDVEAFDIVHAAFNARLFGFLARMTRNRHAAEDLVEETWLRLVRHADRLRPDTRLGPWLFTVARNLHIGRWRASVLEESHAAGLSLWPAAPVPSPFDEAALSELELRIEAALAGLPASHREVLLLVAVEGLSAGDAATVCGISPEALRQRLKRARDLLARRLEGSTALATMKIQEVKI